MTSCDSFSRAARASASCGLGVSCCPINELERDGTCGGLRTSDLQTVCAFELMGEEPGPVFMTRTLYRGGNRLTAVCTEDETPSLASFAATVQALFLASHNSLPFASADCNLFLLGRQERLWQLRAPALGNDFPQL